MMRSIARQPGFPDSRTTTELYRSCMNLSEEAGTLQVQNEGMKRLGLNAQVLAAQAGAQGRGLEAIVSDIGRLSRAIRGVLEALEGSARSLSHSSIEVLRLAAVDAAYGKGLARGIDRGSRETYGTTHAGIRAREKRHRGDLEGRLADVSGLIGELGRIARQMPPVATMIRIVGCEAEGKASELLGTVEELKEFHGRLEAKAERMRQILSECSRHIQALDKEEL